MPPKRCQERVRSPTTTMRSGARPATIMRIPRPRYCAMRLERLRRLRVALIGAAQQIGKGQAAIRRAGLGSSAGRRDWRRRPPSSRGCRSRRADPADRAARGRIRPAMPFRPRTSCAVRQHAGADAFRDGDHHQVAALVHAVEPDRRQHAGVGGILQFHVEPGRLRRSDCGCRGPASSGWARRPGGSAVWSKRPGRLMPTPSIILPFAGGLDALDGCDQAGSARASDRPACPSLPAR